MGRVEAGGLGRQAGRQAVDSVAGLVSLCAKNSRAFSPAS